MNRSTVNDIAMVVVGDSTSHGGVVITGTPNDTWYDIPFARKKDLTFCPKCKPHIFEISEGDSGFIMEEREAALHGHKTACGATLIAKPAPASAVKNAELFLDRKGFDDIYVLRDSNGQIMSNTYYGSQKKGEEIEFGTTDENGHTHLHLTGEESKQITFYIAG